MKRDHEGKGGGRRWLWEVGRVCIVFFSSFHVVAFVVGGGVAKGKRYKD